MYTYPFFQSSHVVYVKMPFHPPDQKRRWYTQSGHFYVGSTAVSAVKCEFARFAKLKQIRRNLAVHAELSICYWSRTDFESYTCIVLQKCTTYDDAWVHEHLLISSWQPALNHPFILKFLKLKSEGWMMQLRKNRQGSVKLSPRLYQRVRRRLFSLGSVPSPHSFQEQAWRILYQISLFTRASYEACKRIRSGEFHTLEVYALYRLANHMEEPGRSRVKSLIGKALLFRNATVPKNNLPLHIPFLALDNFRTNLETWIWQLILQHKNVAIPLVLPTHRLREQGFPKLSEILHNHRKVERRWITSDIENLPCCCKELRSIAKQHIHKTGHVAINLDDVNLPSKLHIFANANANSTYFHSRSQYFNICSNAIICWLKHHGLPPQLAFKFMEKITAEWKLHLDAIDNLPRFSFHAVQHLLHWLPKDCVIHHGDHEQFRLTLFCPQLYFQGALNTWKDPELFEQLPISPQEAQLRIQQAFPTYLVRTYPWGFRKKSRLAVWFCLFETEKDWSKGRTLISYFQSYQSTLLKAVSRCLDSMLREVWPQQSGQQSVPEIWNTIHLVFREIPEEVHLQFLNDDLVGFFNSVPQNRLLDAVHALIISWKERHPGDLSISADLSATGDPIQSTFADTYKKSAYNIRSIKVDDLFIIVKATLTSHYFSALGSIWRQIRGAGIGSQISPTISNLAVTMVERAWQHSFQAFFSQKLLNFASIRYVDNRFAVFDSVIARSDPIAIYSDPGFYGHPVELEKVNDSMLLGFKVSVAERTVTYLCPKQQQIRDIASAGSIRLRLSGLKSRAHLIRKYSFPPSAIEPIVTSACTVVCTAGFFSVRSIPCRWTPVKSKNGFGDIRPWCVSQTLFQRAVRFLRFLLCGFSGQ